MRASERQFYCMDKTYTVEGDTAPSRAFAARCEAYPIAKFRYYRLICSKPLTATHIGIAMARQLEILAEEAVLEEFEGSGLALSILARKQRVLEQT